LSPYKIVFAPVVYVLSKVQAEKIRQYVSGGGVFVTNFRLGVKTESSQIVKKPLPGYLADVMGVTLEDYVPVYAQNPHLRLGEIPGGADVECGIWADILKPESAEVLATYSSGQYSGKAAITANTFGKGKAVYIGADLHPADLSRVLGKFAASAGVKPPLEVPIGVEVTVRKSGSRRWMFVLNHNGAAQTVNLPETYKDALSGESHSGATEIPAYGVLVLTTQKF